MAASSSDLALPRHRLEAIEIPDSESGVSTDDDYESDGMGNGAPIMPERIVNAVPRKPVGGKRKGRR